MDAIKEYIFDENHLGMVSSEVFKLELMLPEGHPVRLQLYKARININKARKLNRDIALAQR